MQTKYQLKPDLSIVFHCSLPCYQCNVKLSLLNYMVSVNVSSFVQFLDKVEVEMRTCEEPRPPNGPSPIAITAGQR